MEREIKFRGILVGGNDFVYGSLMFHKNFLEEKPYIKPRNKGMILWHEVKPETVGQYTGLRDKNNTGEELYEGDVVYIAGYGNYTCEFPFTELYEALHEADSICKKIGNIHHNPELK